ncbi:MAG: N-6 DNA methylase [Planctomycetes bacterium]|nr:N-6 DNA methylase [Planctomycetota bacterium]
MPKCPDKILRLIDQFNHQADQIRSPDYNETKIRIDYINPMFAELGWDIDNSQGYAEQYREVVHEDRVKVAGQTKAPDYSFRVGGQRKFFLEAKKPAVDIRNHTEPAYQLRRYAWSAKLACSLLTDFEELAIYDTRVQPKYLDKASTARREFILYTDYEKRWDFIEGTFSKAAVFRGDFDRYCESKKGRGAQLFDDAFLAEIEEWRKSLATNLAKRNDSLDEPALNFAVQRIIDRILFLRIAEDRGTENVGQLQGLLNGDHAYEKLAALFRRADERYNSGLFHFEKEKDCDEPPDTLTPNLNVDDIALKEIIRALYYPQSPYEFTMVSADSLRAIPLQSHHPNQTPHGRHRRQARSPQSRRRLLHPQVHRRLHRKKHHRRPPLMWHRRPAGGARSVRPRCGRSEATPPAPSPSKGEGRSEGDEREKLSASRAPLTPKEAAKLKILDPACGSGSFLIGAYQFLLDWYLEQYTRETPAALATGKKPVLRPSPSGGWALTIAERKRILLDHIHGVDLDNQAVEVTKLNLLLKCLEGETSQTLGFEQRSSATAPSPTSEKTSSAATASSERTSSAPTVGTT